MHKIAVLPGDGIGPEVVNEGLKVLKALAETHSVKFDFTMFNIDSDRYLSTGKLLTDEDIDELRKFDAIFLGAIGDDRIQPGILEKGILLKARFRFDQYVNYRPAQLWRPFGRLKRDVDFKIDVYRENTEDFYVGIGSRFKKHQKIELDVVRDIYSVKFGLDVESDAEEIAYQIGVERVSIVFQNDGQPFGVYLTRAGDFALILTAISVLDDIRARFVNRHFHRVRREIIQPGFMGNPADKIANRRKAFVASRKRAGNDKRSG